MFCLTLHMDNLSSSLAPLRALGKSTSSIVLAWVSQYGSYYGVIQSCWSPALCFFDNELLVALGFLQQLCSTDCFSTCCLVIAGSQTS